MDNGTALFVLMIVTIACATLLMVVRQYSPNHRYHEPGLISGAIPLKVAFWLSITAVVVSLLIITMSKLTTQTPQLEGQVVFLRYVLASSAFLAALLYLLDNAWFAILLHMEPTDATAPVVPAAHPYNAQAIYKQLKLPPALRVPVMQALSHYFATKPPAELIEGLPNHYSRAKPVETVAGAIHGLLTHLPPANLIGGKGGDTWGKHLERILEQAAHNDDEDNRGWWITNSTSLLPTDLLNSLRAIPIPIAITLKVREENHIHILAKTRWGKTQLLQSLIMDTIDAGIPIIVIDSQEEMLNKLATRVPQDKLILVDPMTCPAGINPFDLESDAASLALLPYMFGGIGSPLIGRQITAFRWLARLVVEAKGDMSLMYQLLEEPEVVQVQYSYQVIKMGIPGQSFFAEYAKTKPKGEYSDTRSELKRRLDTILGDPAFAKMLLSTFTTIDIPKAIRDGSALLISTAKPQIGEDAASLIGRFFISQVLRSAMKAKSRVVLVCDEFQDYAEDSPVLFNILSQSAKYGLELIVAHQDLDKIPTGLRAALMTNANIRLAGGVSAEDRSNLARQMDCEPDFIAQAKKGTFAAKIGDNKPIHFPVPFGRLEALPELDNLPTIHARMRARYGAPSSPTAPSPPAHKPKDRYNPDDG